jgi:hypothetical protein
LPKIHGPVSTTMKLPDSLVRRLVDLADAAVAGLDLEAS